MLDATNQLEDDRLFSAVLREVVEYYVGHGVKIFNVSINDRYQRWNQTNKRTVPRRSWTARTIDSLTRKYDVLFVVSTGNIQLPDANFYLNDGKNYPDYLLEEDSCVPDPGQAALALTIGSVALSTLIAGPMGRTRAAAPANQPSPFTRCGPGIRKEIKPELVEYGGNYSLTEENPRRFGTNRGLDVPMASHRLTPSLSHASGTSFAAARVRAPSSPP